MNLIETGKVMAELKLVYGREIPEEQAVLNQWQKALVNWDYQIISKAAIKYCENYSKAPKPADLVKMAKEIQAERNDRSRKDRAEKMIGGEKTYECPYCHDCRLMIVLEEDDYPVAYPCFCQTGDSKSGALEWQKKGWVFDFGRREWRKEKAGVWLGDLPEVG